MINILSYVGMNMQSEVCLWTLLGLIRTIFDATLFKVNANLKQVWQMSMPEELSMPVQRVLRTMISGIMLVQCFTVYVYLASYIVLLYPVFLEERPTLVLPWLLLAAIRKLLCELTSLALGLGTCVLLGTAKPSCIKFLVAKIVTIMPAFYMWMLVYSYYHVLKVASAYKTFPAVIPPAGRDYGLELAVRRRCTKSLFGEEQLRKKLVAGFYAERPGINDNIPLRNASRSNSSCEESQIENVVRVSTVSHKYTADIGAYEDCFGTEMIIPRGDRIIEQFIVMLLRISAYFNKDGAESIKSQMFNSALTTTWATRENMEAMPTDVTDTPPLVANGKGHTATYLREYPQIFMKKLSSESTQPERKASQVKNSLSNIAKLRISTGSSKLNKYNEKTLDLKKHSSDKTISICKEKSSQSSINNNTTLTTLKEIRQETDFFGESSNKRKYTEQETSDNYVLGNNDIDILLSTSKYASTEILLPTQREIEQNPVNVSLLPKIASKENVIPKGKVTEVLKIDVESQKESTTSYMKAECSRKKHEHKCELNDGNVENKRTDDSDSTNTSNLPVINDINNKSKNNDLSEEREKK